MRNIVLLLFFCLFIDSNAQNQNESIIKNIIDSLNRLGNFKVECSEHYINPDSSEGNSTGTFEGYINKLDTISGYKFIQHSNSSINGDFTTYFDGEYSLTLNKQNKTYYSENFKSLVYDFHYKDVLYSPSSLILPIKSLLKFCLKHDSIANLESIDNNYVLQVKSNCTILNGFYTKLDCNNKVINSIVRIDFDKNTLLPQKYRFTINYNDGYVTDVYQNYKFSKIDFKEVNALSEIPSDYSPVVIGINFLSIKGKPANNFELQSLDGDTIKLSKLKGNNVLLIFSSPNCGACRKSIPYINEIYNKYKSQLQILYIDGSYNSNVPYLKQYILKENIKFQCLKNGGTISTSYCVNGFPTFILLDQEGKYYYRMDGFIGIQPLEDKINNLIN